MLQDLTGDEIDEMIREADLDGDGKVKKLVKSFKTKKFNFGFLHKFRKGTLILSKFTNKKDVLDSRQIRILYANTVCKFSSNVTQHRNLSLLNL